MRIGIVRPLTGIPPGVLLHAKGPRLLKKKLAKKK
jgi:hypothetical protein